MSIEQTIQDYTGRYPRIDDPLMRAAYLRGVTVSAVYYPPGTADWDQKARQVEIGRASCRERVSSVV